jgi:hypothetical protein
MARPYGFQQVSRLDDVQCRRALIGANSIVTMLGVSKKYHGRVGELVRRSLREGQLFWTVIAMCAAASYEAAVHLGELKGNAATLSTGRTIAWASIVWHLAMIITSSVLVLLGTVDAADEDAQTARSGSTEDSAHFPRIMIASILISIGVAVSFTVTHLWAN